MKSNPHIPQPELDVRAQGMQEEIEQKSLYQLFADQCEKTPDARALIDGEDVWSYQDLKDKADTIAGLLNSFHLEKAAVVALDLERSALMVCSILACMKLSRLYLPIDNHFPDQRIDFMLRDSAAEVVITDKPDQRKWPETVQKIICPEDIAEYKAAAVDTFASMNLDDPLYIIYTSGTTGRPKGIIQTQRCVSNLIQWQNQHSKIDFTKTVLQFASFGFDVYFQEIFSPLTMGGCVCLVSDHAKKDPQKLIHLIDRFGISVLFLPVAVLVAVFEDPKIIPKTITDIITAGEPLVLSDKMRKFLENHPYFRLHNHYGVSESHVVTQSSFCGAEGLPDHPSIGRPISNVQIAVLDEQGLPVEGRDVGEIWIAGACLAKGYLNLAEKTAQSFVTCKGGIWYRTGDFAYYGEGGSLHFVGRKDDQVKVHGHLVVLSEIETALLAFDGVENAVCLHQEVGRSKSIVAHLVADENLSVEVLRSFFEKRLPDFMQPEFYRLHGSFPMGVTGKIDRKSLLAPDVIDRSSGQTAFKPAFDEKSESVLSVLGEVTGFKGIGMSDRFDALGLNSLKIVRATHLLSQLFGEKVPVTHFFESQNAEDLHALLNPQNMRAKPIKHHVETDVQEIAIIGMAGVFPGADTVDDLWHKLSNDLNLLEEKTDVSSETSPLVPNGGNRKRWVGKIADALHFDADFFSISRNDALWMDPQQRKFLEQCWACFEDAAVNPDEVSHNIGVFAGSAESSYLFNLSNQIENSADYLNAVVGGDKDFLASRVAYHLNLYGPAMNVQSACSTGLLAVHQACNALQNGDCDMALAGASSLLLPQDVDLPFVENAIFSKDGLTRPFDINRSGTTMTNAVGVVLLKPLEAALRDGDPIRCVIKSSHVVNDGARKNAYAAPSVRGQVDCISGALSKAGIKPSDLSFIETHGTATKLGDEVEIAALKQVFDNQVSKPCHLTSIKSHVGHSNRAAGIVGLMGAALSLEHRTLLKMKHFDVFDPALEINEDQFVIEKTNTQLAQDKDVFGSVSSYGIGGTNVHMVLQTPPIRERKEHEASLKLFTLSAPNKDGLDQRCRDLIVFIKKNDPCLKALSKTLLLGRKDFKQRLAIAASNHSDLIEKLEDALLLQEYAELTKTPKVAFIFPGVGPQYQGMGQSLYQHNAVFKEVIDQGCAYLKSQYDYDFKNYFDGNARLEDLESSCLTQTLLFLIEIACVRALESFGLKSDYMLGLSGGEFASAHLSGAFSFEDGLYLVHERGRLMDEQSIAGGALTVKAPAKTIEGLLTDGVYIAGFLNKRMTLVAGELRDIYRFENVLDDLAIDYKRLANTNANHTHHMKKAAAAFADIYKNISISPLSKEFVSPLTGEVIAKGTVLKADHWVQHFCEPIAFEKAMMTLHKNGCDFVVEAAPQATSCQLFSAQFDAGEDISIKPAMDRDFEIESFAHVLGAFWQAGGDLDKAALVPWQNVSRIALPPYKFAGKRYWLPYEGKKTVPQIDVSYWQIRQRRHRKHQEKRDVSGRWQLFFQGDNDDALIDQFQRSDVLFSHHTLGIYSPTNWAQNFVLVRNHDASHMSNALSLGNWIDQCSKTSGHVHVVLISLGPEIDQQMASAAIVAEQEYGGLTCQYIHCPDQRYADLVDLLLSGVQGDSPILQIGGGRTYEAGLQQIIVPKKEASLFNQEKTVVLVGGTGSVGRVLAPYLLEKYNLKLVLMGRKALADDPEKKSFIDQLNTKGRASYFEADITDNHAVSHCIQDIKKEYGGIDVILHMASVIEDETFLNFLSQLSEDHIATQLKPKVDGLQALDRALKENEIDPIKIAFSSVSVFLGGTGYFSYTYANRCFTDLAITNDWSVYHWDVWQSEDQSAVLGSSFKGDKISPYEAVEAMEQAFANQLDEVAIFKRSPFDRVKKLQESSNTNPTNKDTDLFETIRLVWQEKLAREDLPDHADFLRYGGDSLTAVRITLDLRKRLDVEINPSLLIRYPVLSTFVRQVEKLQKAEPNIQAVKAQQNLYRASPLQSRWFHMYKQGYGNLIMPCLIKGNIDEERLFDAIHEFISSSHALRTVYFQNDQGHVMGRILGEDVVCHMKQGPIDANDEKALHQWILERESQLVDIHENAPFLGWFFRLTDGSLLLVFQTHHICFDGWSGALFLDGVRRIYQGEEQSVDYVSYDVAAQKFWQFLESETGRVLRQSWLETFKSPPQPVRPKEDGNGDINQKQAHKASFILQKHAVENLKKQASNKGQTLFTVLLTGFVEFLHQSSGQDDLIFGTTSSGRLLEKADETIGVFVNPHLLRVRMDEGDIESQVNELSNRIQESMAYPIIDLHEHHPDLSKQPLNDLFHSYFLYQNFKQPDVWRDVDVIVGEGDDDISKDLFPLSCFSADETTLMRPFEIIVFEQPNGGLSFNVWGRKSLYSCECLDNYARELQAIILTKISSNKG